MSLWQIQTGGRGQGSRVGKSAATGCLFLFALPFAAFGVFAAVQAFRELGRGNGKQAVFLGLFALVFGSAGFGLMIGSVYGGRKLKENRARQERNPDQPWLWREDWANNRVVAANRQTMILAWVFAVFWNTISSFVWIVLPEELAKGNKMILIALLFPLVGLGLLVWAIRATLRWRRFGQSTLELAATPAPLGGQLSGLISSQHPFTEARSIRLRLACVRRESSGDSTHERLLWEDEKILDTDAVRSTGGIPVFFNLPAEGEPASPTNQLPQVIWRLEASAALPGIDYAARFEVPVFKVAGAAADSKPAEDPTARWQKDAREYRPDPSSPIRVQTTARGEKELVFPAARYPGQGVSLLVFTAIWNGFLWLLLTMKAPIIFPIVWIFVDVLLLLGLVNIWLGKSRIVAATSGLEVKRSWLLVRRVWTWNTSEVADVIAKMGTTSGNKVFYNIKVVTTGGRQYTAATMIRDKHEAEWLAAQVRDALGLRPRTPEPSGPTTGKAF